MVFLPSLIPSRVSSEECPLHRGRFWGHGREAIRRINHVLKVFLAASGPKPGTNSHTSWQGFGGDAFSLLSALPVVLPKALFLFNFSSGHRLIEPMGANDGPGA